MAKMNEYPSVDDQQAFTPAQKAAFLGSAMCIATGSIDQNPSTAKVTANIPLTDIVPEVPEADNDTIINVQGDLKVARVSATEMYDASGLTSDTKETLTDLDFGTAGVDYDRIVMMKATNRSGQHSIPSKVKLISKPVADVVSCKVPTLAANHADVGKVLTVEQDGDTDRIVWDVVQGGGGGLTPPENIGDWINTYDHTTLLKNYTQFGLGNKDVQIQLDPVVVDGKYTSYKLRYFISEGSAGFASPAFGSGSIA